jgi:hypothetical protein
MMLFDKKKSMIKNNGHWRWQFNGRWGEHGLVNLIVGENR